MGISFADHYANKYVNNCGMCLSKLREYIQEKKGENLVLKNCCYGSTYLSIWLNTHQGDY